MGQVPTPPILSHAVGTASPVRRGTTESPLRVLLAPNAFKGSLSAAATARAMQAGVQAVVPDAECVLLPVADGGDGSIDAFAAAGFDRHPIVTRGPTGAPAHAAVALHGPVGVVELASTCGLVLLPHGDLAPMDSSTLGLGDAIRLALDLGVGELVVCLGGSASTDGGTGVLVALGARLLDDEGDELPPSGRSLSRIATVDLAGLDPRLRRTAITVAADVSSPLVGPSGAAAVFAPQKGATSEQVAELDDGLRTWAGVLAAATGVDASGAPGSGAAGGAAVALLAACRAQLRPGAEVVAEVLGLEAAIASVDLVVTGEGRLDQQSRLGKGATDVARRAVAAGVPVLAICGSIDVGDDDLRAAGFAGWRDCVSRASSQPDAMARGAELVAAATADALRDLLAATAVPR